MAGIVTKATEPVLGAIKLAWWREALVRLDSAPPPAEPRLQAAAEELLPLGVTGAMLAELENGWAALLEETVDLARVAARGAHLFAMAAQLLAHSDALLASAGRLYATEAAFRSGLAADQPPVNELDALAGHRFERGLRPLTALARLAARDARQAPRIEPEATPGRAAALIAHRLTGTIA